MAQLFVGLMAEGPTDYRFLLPIIEKTLIDIALHASGDIDISVFEVKYEKNGGFNDYVLSASKNGINDFGIMLLVIHSDSDDSTSTDTYQNKILPAFRFIEKQPDEDLCKGLVALVPVYETESWMLADKDLFKRKIGTNLSDAQLGIAGHPESFNNPKEKIESAIKIGRSTLPNKLKNNLKIGELYLTLGETITIDKLARFTSFQNFRTNIEEKLRNLNLLHSF